MLDSFRTDGTITSWLANSEVTKDANVLKELPRHNPVAAWCIIVKVLHQPESEKHLAALSDCLKSLIIHHADEFIDLIETQAALDSQFKACLAEIQSYSGSRIPKK